MVSYISEKGQTFQSLLLGLTFGYGQFILCACRSFCAHVELVEQDVLCQIAGGRSLVPLTAIIPPPSI